MGKRLFLKKDDGAENLPIPHNKSGYYHSYATTKILEGTCSCEHVDCSCEQIKRIPVFFKKNKILEPYSCNHHTPFSRRN